MLTPSRKYNLTPVYVTIIVLVFVVARLNLSFYKLKNESAYPVMVQTGPSVTGIGPASFSMKNYAGGGGADMSYSSSLSVGNSYHGRNINRSQAKIPLVVNSPAAASYASRGIEISSNRSSSSSSSAMGMESYSGFSSSRSNTRSSSGVVAPMMSMPGMPSDLRLMAKANSLLPADEEVLSAISSSEGSTLMRLPGTPTSTDGFETPVPSGILILLLLSGVFGFYKIVFAKS